MTGKPAQAAARDRRPGRLQRRAAVGDAGGGGEHGLDAFADDQLRSGRPQLDHAGAAEGEAIDLADLAFPQLERDAWIPVGSSVSGSRISASRQGCSGPGPNGQRARKRRLSLMFAGSAVTIDAAGLGEVAFGERAGDRHGLRPELERAGGLALPRSASRTQCRAIPVAGSARSLPRASDLRRG